MAYARHLVELTPRVAATLHLGSPGLGTQHGDAPNPVHISLELNVLQPPRHEHGDAGAGAADDIADGYFMRDRRAAAAAAAAAVAVEAAEGNRAPQHLPSSRKRGVEERRRGGDDDSSNGSPAASGSKRARRSEGGRSRRRDKEGDGHDVWAQCERCERWRRLRDGTALPEYSAAWSNQRPHM